LKPHFAKMALIPLAWIVWSCFRVTVGKRGGIQCWVGEGKVVRPCLFPVEVTALYKDASIITLFDEHLVLPGLIGGGFFAMAKHLV
jgi:hypothetical protein